MAKKNPWLIHLSKIRKMKQNKGKSFKEIAKIAKKSYTPIKKK